ncbi:MAG: hypothetical protein KC636_29985, partial [Myxococcales bacterium]|nr:hypothetical protein [Myxococcales bacterium]
MAPPRNSEFLELDEEDGEDEDAPALVRAARPIAPTRARDLVDEAAAAEGRGEPTLQRARRVTATMRERAIVNDDDAREGERLPERASVRPGAPARESSRALEFDDDEADAEEQAPTRRPLGPQRVA